MTNAEQLRAGAVEWFEAAKESHAAGHRYAAFESYRHATELACTAILLEHRGVFPRDHAVAAPLAQAGLVPSGVAVRDLQNFLAEFTLGTYGFERQLHEADLQKAKRMTRRLIEALRE